MENQSIGSKEIVKSYGLLLGGTSILISIIQYALGDHLSPKPIYGTLSFALMAALIVVGIKKFKAANEGYLSFGEAAKIGVGIALVSAVISIVYNQLFMTFIEPDFMNQILLQQQEDMFNKGMSEKEIELAAQIGEKLKGPFISSAIGLVASAFIGFVISAITGAILKNTKEA